MTYKQYEAFGLSFRSEILLPELRELNNASLVADVSIIYGDILPAWNRFNAPENHFVYSNNTLYFAIENVALFGITGGHTITVDPAPDCDMRKLRLYLLGTCMGAILLNRRILPLHGSAFVIDGQAYAIVGESGAGKSTLAAYFSQQGYKLLTDDVIAVSIDPVTGRAMVIPSYPQQKLWEESIDGLQLDNQYETLYEEQDRTKYAIPVQDRFMTETIPLAGIFELNKSEHSDIKFEKLSGITCMPLLFTHTFRNFLVSLLGLNQWHFTSTASITSQTAVYRLHRPTSHFTVQQLFDTIMSQIKEGVSVQ
ncbi:aldolase (plasmid) [Paenibacillus cellulosilyticus]|nr:aldolase [Paenibacillus cellulosilyticus]